MSFELSGFDELEKKLDDMAKAASELENTATVKLEELFTNPFMSKYTVFSTFDEFIEAGNFVVNSQEDFEAIPDDEMDLHVQQTTRFLSWQSMLDKAGEIYVSKKLGFD